VTFLCSSYADILQSPASHKKKPSRHGYERTHINRKIDLFLISFLAASCFAVHMHSMFKELVDVHYN
jgi:hypothetical protein